MFCHSISQILRNKKLILFTLIHFCSKQSLLTLFKTLKSQKYTSYDNLTLYKNKPAGVLLVYLVQFH
jgi:hypothetical protein